MTGDEERTELAKKRTDYAAQRNEMAAERTFSAWVRTGLAGVGGGVALLRFMTFSNPENVRISKVAGEMLLLWGMLVIIFGLVSYYRTCWRIGLERVDKTLMAGVTAIALVAFLLSVLVYVIS